MAGRAPEMEALRAEAGLPSPSSSPPRKENENNEPAFVYRLPRGGTTGVTTTTAATVAETAAAAALPRVVSSEAAFVACGAFGGPRVGYVFKRGDRGLGYYKDDSLKPGATHVRP